MTDFLATILTARCRIAPLEDADAAALAAITDASVTQRISFLPEPFTPADARMLIGRRGMGDRFHGIWSREEDRLLGVIGVHHARRRREIEIGYWMAAAARGQGLAREALQALTARLSLRHPECRIVAECHPDNGPSWELLQRVGFTPTGQAGQRPGRVLFARGARHRGRIDVC